MIYKLKILTVLIIIFSVTNVFSDSLPITNTLITNNVCDLSPSIGLRADKLILADLYGWKEGYLFSSFGGYEETAPDKSWIITEPIGGVLGGILGLSFTIFTFNEVGIFTGYSLGCGVGIWGAGHFIEKEKGSLLWATVGSMAGTFIILVAANYLDNHYNNVNYEVFVSMVPLVAPILGLTLYRLTLGKGDSGCLGIK
jgi:hypothetical protein